MRATAVLGTTLLGLAVLVGTGNSQDAKKDSKSYLPPGWKALNLTKEQKSDISKIHGSYKAKVKDLEDKIAEAKKMEKQEMVKLLTDDQKDNLRKLAIGEDTPAPAKDAAPKKDAVPAKK